MPASGDDVGGRNECAAAAAQDLLENGGGRKSSVSYPTLPPELCEVLESGPAHSA